MTSPSVGLSGAAIGMVLVALAPLAGCDGGEDEAGVELPGAAQSVVDATLDGAGLEVEYRVLPRVGEQDPMLRAVATLDVASGDVYQTGFTTLPADEEDEAAGEEYFLGESWAVGGTTYTRDPGAETARLSSGSPASLLLGDDVGSPDADVAEGLAALLDGWPGETVATDETIEGVAVVHVRLGDAEDDREIVDLWVDGDARLVRVERRPERSPAIYVRLDLRVLGSRPSLPSLPPVEG